MERYNCSRQGRAFSTASWRVFATKVSRMIGKLGAPVFPAATQALRNRLTCLSNSSMAEWGPMIQSSPILATRSTAASALAAIQIGGRGVRTGLGAAGTTFGGQVLRWN